MEKFQLLLDGLWNVESLTLFMERYLGLLSRHVPILGSLFLIFWVLKPKWIESRRVPQERSLAIQPLKEALLSLHSYVFYVLAGLLVASIAKTTGHSMMYTSVAEYGWIYTIFSFILFFFWVDTVFYWTHRLMHWSKMVFRVHKTHHNFVNVTPLTAYAFHSGEAILNAGSFMIMLLVLPWHPMVLFAFILVTIFMNGIIHSGYDVFPKSWRTNPILKYVNTPTHHSVHHQRFDCNYSFVFTFWDKWMRTEKLPAN